ncbi:EAL domain-containing protein [Geobacter pelophilus]|uniref:EAL domain-containing protein n=1 Tax=Geoanaerobacter pelophilus TaxID=60036 RepID=A0AAW4LB33_9BACT|nr:EAL domain-containing protein [Geoanaerobacter pelophilus]MBT0665586.1 EAL domain-containing protein [Geoanaerobacter pelophilus]
MKGDARSIVRVTSIIAGIFAAFVAIVIPLGHFTISYQFLMGSLDAQADLSSRNINSIVHDSPNMWQFEQIRLIEMLERRPLGNIPEQRRIIDTSGTIVAESADRLTPPVVAKSHNIYDAGRVVARVEICRSLYPILSQTVMLAFASIALSIIVFIALRTIPLRAVRKAYASMEESEARYRSLYESMNEGVALHRIATGPGGEATFTVIDMNAAAELILNIDRNSTVGSDGAKVFGAAIKDHLPDILSAAKSSGTISFEYPMESISRVLSIAIFFPSPGAFATLIEDVTDKKRSEEQIKRLAYYDILTGLPNRQLLQDRLDQALARATREGGKVALMFIDLDRFKFINDTLGHAYGDLLLVQVSLRLRDCLRSSDTIARLGGDEFVILLSYMGEELNAAHVAQHLLEQAALPFDLGTRQVSTSISIGIAIFPTDGLDGQALLSSADMAMYAAKERGRNMYNFFSQEMNVKAHERMELETSLRAALERDEFFVEFQPIVTARTCKVVAAEALVRWNHPEQGRIMPDSFIPLAEETNLIVTLGDWVLRTVCRKMKQWADSGVPPLRVSVNVSGMQFRQANFVDDVAKIIGETGVDPRLLELELTETSLMEHADATVKSLFRLKELEVGIALDDFGSGYSSLTYLKNFPIDRVKIDRSFIKDVCETPDDKAIVEAIIALAMSLNLYIIAEGVETPEQVAFLQARNCDEIQGFHFYRPLSEEKLLELLKSL